MSLHTLSCESDFIVAGLQKGEDYLTPVRIFSTLCAATVTSSWFSSTKIRRLKLFFAHWLRWVSTLHAMLRALYPGLLPRTCSHHGVVSFRLGGWPSMTHSRLQQIIKLRPFRPSTPKAACLFCCAFVPWLIYDLDGNFRRLRGAGARCAWCALPFPPAFPTRGDRKRGCEMRGRKAAATTEVWR